MSNLKDKDLFSHKTSPPSKFHIAQNRRKSFIPLPKPRANPQSFPSSLPTVSVLPAAQNSHQCVFKRNFRSIHSSSFPPNIDNNTEINTQNQSEGSLISTSTLSLPKSSEFLLKWNKGDVNVTTTSSKSDQQLLQSQISTYLTEGNKPEACPNIFLLALAWRTAEIALRTRGHFLCPICSEPFTRPVVIACGHMNCMECINNWFVDQDSCPCCRYRFILKEYSSTPLTENVLEAGALLASTFTAGNFLDHLMPERINVSGSGQSSLEIPTDNVSQSTLIHFIADAFRKLFQANCGDSTSENDKRTESSEENFEHCFKASIWFLRHGLKVLSGKQFLKQLKFENEYGSRESFLKLIMTTNVTNAEKDESLKIPLGSLQMDSWKQRSNVQPTLRFRVPSAQGFVKILMTGFIFAVIVLAVYLVDNLAPNDVDKTNSLHKIDFSVYGALLFIMITYSETERITYWRRQRRRLT